jgi:N-methylhydantoinase B
MTTMQHGLPEAIFREILRGAFASTVQEMSLLVERTAMSPIIREKQDYAVGLFDAEGRMILAQFLMQGPGMIEPILARFPLGTMRPGDVYCYNDPYLSAGAVGHAPDLCFALPVFDRGEVRAFIALFGHFWDIGGIAAGGMSPQATEVFHEGVLIPPVRLVGGGVYADDLYRLIIRNTRFPQFLEGDVRACISACQLGVRRIEELFAGYGVERVISACGDLLAQSAVAGRAILEGLLPEGVWHGDDSVDDDGFGGGPFRVALKVERSGDRISFDFTETDEQARGPINFLMHEGILTSVILGRLLQSQDETLVLNDGLAAAVDEIRIRPGSLLSPRFPGGVALRALSRILVTNAIIKALGQAVPERIAAASCNYGIVTIRGTERATGRFLYCFDGFGVGQGARPWADGIDSIYFIGQKNNPVEWIEAEYPFRVEEYAVATDSGGPGKMRGGVGVVRQIRVRQDGLTLCAMMVNAREPAFGIAGGGDGRLGSILLNPGTPQERRLPTLADNIALADGDVIRIVSAGGGGWGPALDRDPEAVARDVRRGYVSLEGARRDYGVAVDPDTLALDWPATRELRGQEATPVQPSEALAHGQG